MMSLSDPMCARLRFLWMPGISFDRDLVRGVEAASGSAIGGYGGGTIRQAAKLDAVSDRHLEFGNNRASGLAGPDITFIGRMNWHGTGGQVAFGFQNGTTAGFCAIFGDNGSTEDGFCSAVFGGGTFFEVASLSGGVGAAAVSNISRTYAATYRASDKRLTLWIDGQQIYTTTNTSQSWSIDTNSNIFIGKQPGVGNNLIADVEWMAAFDGCLADEEIRQWMRDDRWPFDYYVTDYDILRLIGATSLSTTMGMRAIMARVGSARTFTTTIEALADLDGSQTGGGQSGTGTRSFTTQIGIRSSGVGHTPTLRKFSNIIGLASTATLSKRAVQTTQIGVRSRMKRKINGRVDLIGTRIYRR